MFEKPGRARVGIAQVIICFGDRFLGEGGFVVFFIPAGPFFFWAAYVSLCGNQAIRSSCVASKSGLRGAFTRFFFFFFRGNLTVGRFFPVCRERVKVALVAHLLGSAFVSTKGGRGGGVWSSKLSVLLRLLKSRGGILLV